MMKSVKGKKGEKVISVYWFVILFIVAAAIVYMTAVFYGNPYDVREIEADILTDKIAECLTDSGYLADLKGMNQENFMQKCNLNFETEDVYGWKEQEQFYVEAEVREFDTANPGILLKVNKGNENFKDFCSIKGEGLPFCLERNFYSIDKQGNKYDIRILSVVGKVEKNV